MSLSPARRQAIPLMNSGPSGRTKHCGGIFPSLMAAARRGRALLQSGRCRPPHRKCRHTGWPSARNARRLERFAVNV